MRWSGVMFAGMAAVAVLVAGCAGSDSGTSTTESESAGGGSGSEALTITSPEDGAEVTSPFTLEFDAGDIGPEETGKDHVHIFVDGEESDYTVVTENTFEIEGLPAGEHTVTLTKQHADHSPTGDESEITVEVTEGDSSDDTSGDTSGNSGNDQPDYDY
ncbi:Ig-like domain-containing protein [Actinopolymorpha sp. B11F2]|uniref:Ig-like domain-containing protein n=1 Tax=Actinopolymorpha sp. B11F2 TaxID=3160862 RepID=UPI0032E4F1F2